MNSHSYIPKEATILEKKQVCENDFTFKLRLKGVKKFSFIPGQFVMVSVLGFGEVPIGITSAPKDNVIEIGVRSSGLVTKEICSLEKGDAVGISGPFGNGFPVAKMKGTDVVLVAGGIGLFPLRSVIKSVEIGLLKPKSLTILVGSRCQDSLPFSEEYLNWGKFAKIIPAVESCDKNWTGCVGNIASTFPKAKLKKGSVVIVCGPPVMYRPIAETMAGKITSEENLYFMFERKMKCGIGKCQHCICGKLYTCLDGPVFSYSDLTGNGEDAL